MQVTASSPISSGMASKDTSNSTIGMDGFFKIFAAELQNQDPSNPQSNTEYIAQMAQFSALEAMNNLNTQMQQMLKTQQFQEANLMIGKIAKLTADDGSTVTGEVTSAKFSDGKASVIVNGNEYSVDKVMELSDKGSEVNVSQSN